MTRATCPTCGFQMMDRHTCAPLFAVDIFGKGVTPLAIYARNASEAAMEAVKRLDEDGSLASSNATLDVLVTRELDFGSATSRFDVTCRTRAVYEAHNFPVARPRGVVEIDRPESPLKFPGFLTRGARALFPGRLAS